MYTMIDAAVKAALLLALVAIIAVLSRRVSASFRHLTWALGLGCALCLPLLSQNLPHWRIPIAALPTHSRPAAEEAPPLADVPQSTAHVSIPSTPRTKSGIPSASALPNTASEPPAVQLPAPAPDSTAHPSTAPAPQVSWTTLLLLVWLGGSLLMLAQLAQGLLKVRRIATTSVTLVFGPIADAAAAAMSIGRHVALRQASSPGQVTVPFTYGLLRPVIVLPAEATQWPEERLRAALLHEMAHVRRHDWALQVMGHVARALYWFNPLVWVATRRLRAESEAAADDLVLSVGMPAAEYARHLLDVALAARQSRRISQGAVAMAQSPKVEERLRAVLAQSLSRHPVTRRAAAGFVAVTLLVALPTAALRLVAQTRGVPVPAADRLQLHGDFTLTYAVTVRNQQTTAMLFHEYQELRRDYKRELAKDPNIQPVPEEFYMPFATYQKRRTQTRHVVTTVSTRAHSLLYQTVENNDTYAQLYDGHNTQAFGNGHAGPMNPGRQIVTSECPLPAVGLPFIPLLKNATLVGSSGAHQTWQASIVDVGAAQGQGEAFYEDGVAHAVNDGGEWKLLDTDNTSQQWQFFQHQSFQGHWVASHMRLIKYDIDVPFPPKEKYPTLKAAMSWFKAVRKPSEVIEYRLLSASEVPFDPSILVKRPSQSRTPGFFIAEDEFLQEALHLRYHLQGWAGTHKALLQNMANAAPSDKRVAVGVGQSLRNLPFPLWQGDPRPNHVWDGDPRIGHDGQKPLFKAESPSAQANLASRDFEIARSLNPGKVHIILWASGRITRNTAQGIKGRETQHEVVPAFVGADGTTNMAGGGSEASINASSPPSAPRLKPAVGFRRYTSPPLPDGTRYTFLYPSYFANVHPGWLDSDHQFRSVRIDCIGTKPFPWIAAPGQAPVAYYIHGKQGAAWPAPHEEFCSVVVGKAAPPFWQGPRPLEIDRQWIGEYGSHHDFSIKDAHTHYRFEVIHEDRYTPALFRQTDPVIVASFRILPPGASAPKLPQPAIVAARMTVPPAEGGGDTAAAHVARGKQLQEKGQPRDGIPEFRRAVQIDPNNAEAQAQLARALSEINKGRVGNAPEREPKPNLPTTMTLSIASASAPKTLLAQSLTKIPGPRAAHHNLPSGAIAIPKASRSLPPPQTSPLAADTGVTAAQEQLRRVAVGYRAGINSRGEVNVAATALAEARIRSAVARNEFTGLTPDLEAVVRNKQELLEETQLRFRAGASATTTVNRAEEAVVEARVRTDLYAILKARQSALSQIKALYRSGATSSQEVDNATAALQKAQHAFISNGSE